MVDIGQVRKIDIGSGTRPKEGFTTVDLYKDADVHADICALPFANGQIEEINASHVLEHIPRKKLPMALSECLRVLKPGGRIYVEVPDFEFLVDDWRQNSGDGRWGHRIERIYGQQSFDGDYHYGAFDTYYLQRVLDRAGFGEISVTKKMVEFHDGVLQAWAKKP